MNMYRTAALKEMELFKDSNQAGTPRYSPKSIPSLSDCSIASPRRDNFLDNFSKSASCAVREFMEFIREFCSRGNNRYILKFS